MKHLVLIAAVALAAGSAGVAAAAAAAATPAAKAPFGCEARAGSTCYFRIFYAAGRSRDVVLPAGMKQHIPEVRIGHDSYCVTVNAKPRNKCARKVIGAGYNS
jgi:hypothetical protein